MDKVTLLTQGYARRLEDGGIRASPSATLIEDLDIRTLVDPGANKVALLDGLYREGLKPDDINIIFLTHYHLDHLLNIRLFLDENIYDVNTMYCQDIETHYESFIP
ncbi:MAG: MBL fold metallo-hydrolase [Methanotrichaceae archaeon]